MNPPTIWRSITVPLATMLMLACSTAPANAASADEVAGRSVKQYAEQLQSDDRTVRLRAVKSLGAFGPSAMSELQKALDHPDAAVRYTAAVHLGRIGGQSPEATETLTASAERLHELMKDEASRATQMAAAFALCRAGQMDAALPLLVERLQSSERSVACSAAELIGMLGPAARSAKPTLESVRAANRPGGSGDYHIGGAAQNALRSLDSETP